jgi:hypothetical protein
VSITFSTRRSRIDYDDDAKFINLANRNAIDLLRWIGIEVTGEGDLYGELPATELAARCRRRLWPEARNNDPGLDGSDTKQPGRARVIMGGRRPGYLRERTGELLRLCEKAGDGGVIYWG